MNTFRRPLRRLAVLSVSLAAVAAGLIAPATATVTSSASPAATATATVTAPAGVTGADLPQLARAARTFPYLKGGAREITRGSRLEVADRSCYSQSRGVKAESVRFASFLMLDGERPYFFGKEDPTYVVYEFADRVKARAAYGRITDFVQRCQGRTATDVGSVTVDSVRLPRLGARQAGYRTTTIDDTDLREDLEVYVLQGKRIERSWIQLDGRGASVKHVVRMAKVLATTAR